jgi:hypothetical protein
MVLIMPRSRAVRLSPAAATALVDRLEAAGLTARVPTLHKPQADPGEAIETGVAALAARLDRLQAPASHAALNRSTAD